MVGLTKQLKTMAVLALAGLMLAGPVTAAEVERAVFGRMADGTEIEIVTLSNADGVQARVITYGAALQALLMPDARGQVADIVLGYDDLEGYVERPGFYGVTVGRYANRIAGAAFSLDGVRHELAANDGTNGAHGGRVGFDKVVWAVESIASGPEASVTLFRISPDGEEGFPGELAVRVTYSLSDSGDLTIRHEATTSKPTIVNLTNHSYFNLGGAPTGAGALDHRLTIVAETMLPVNDRRIPTGAFRPVEGTPFDFRQPRLIGDRIRDAGDEQLLIGRGYDHTFVLAREASDTPRWAARLEHPASGRVLELLTTEPGVQLYTSNFMNGGGTGKGGRLYRQTDAVCLEPQKFPNSPNEPSFPSARLDPGETYRHISVYRLSTVAGDAT